jgi:hypothetical protein
MNTLLRYNPATEVAVINEASLFASPLTEVERARKKARSGWMESPVRLARAILWGAVGILAMLYLLGVCAFAAGLIYYTIR